MVELIPLVVCVLCVVAMTPVVMESEKLSNSPIIRWAFGASMTAFIASQVLLIVDDTSPDALLAFSHWAKAALLTTVVAFHWTQLRDSWHTSKSRYTR